MSGGLRNWEPQGDYRAKATRGVALAAVMLLLPFTFYALLREVYVVALGGTYITTVLIISSQLVARGRDHEPMTLYALVPGGILFMSLAFLVDANMASIWCFPSILACYCMLGLRKAIIANLLILAFAIPMMWTNLDIVVSARITASLVAISLFASILVREIDAQQRKFRYQLNHDPLTGLLNRMSLKSRLQESIDAYQNRLTPATLLAVDLDHFKNVNDRYGHDTGDQVLCEVARLLKQHTGDTGAVFRLGGEEFLILLVGSDAIGARERAELLRVQVAEAVILQGHQITTSIGLATLLADDDRERWTRRSDNRLYAAKRGGRNRVVSEGGVDLEHPDASVIEDDSGASYTEDKDLISG